MPDSLDTPPSHAPFGAALVERGALSSAALERAVRLQAETGEPLSAVLTKLGLVSERALAEAFATYLDLPITATKDFPETPVLDERISRKFLKRTRVIPLEDGPDGLVLALADPLDQETIEALSFALK